MDEQDILLEESKPTRKLFQTKEKWAFIIAISLLLFIYFLHFFGDWSMSRTETISNGEKMSREVSYSYENKCLLFNQSHIDEVYESEKTYKKNSNSLRWVIINSFRFTFTGHIITWLIIMGTLFILYWFADSNKNKLPTQTTANKSI